MTARYLPLAEYRVTAQYSAEAEIVQLFLILPHSHILSFSHSLILSLAAFVVPSLIVLSHDTLLKQRSLSYLPFFHSLIL